MVGTKTKKRNRLSIILAGIVVLLLALLLAASNFLFEYALDPSSSFFMGRNLSAGQSEEGETAAPAPQPTEAEQQWRDYCVQASEWFQDEGEGAVLTSWDGLTLQAHWFQRDDSHRYAIVCHGYGGAPAQMAGYAMSFYEMGCSVLVPAARAHETSGGEYIGMGWPERKDMLGWIDQIIARDPQAEILLFGVSMGGATVMMTAGEDLPAQVKCIVEDCGYTSVWDEFALQLESLFGLPEFPLLYTASLICQVRADYSLREASAVEQLEKAEVPMLFIHGEEDTFVPYAMLDQVYEACASEEKQKLSVPGAVHGAAASADPVLYWTAVESFVDQYLT